MLEVADLLPKLRHAAKSIEMSQLLLNGPVLKHLHDQCGLDLITSLQMKQFLASDKLHVQTDLVRTLFPDVRKQLDAEQVKKTEMLSNWGFDESSLSLFTGRLIPDRGLQSGFNVGWRDQSVRELLARPIARNQEHRQRRERTYVPVLVSFDAPLPKGETAAIAIRYDIDLDVMPDRFDALPRFFRGEGFAAISPTSSDVVVSVTCPTDIQPIIAPAPREITVQADDDRRFDVRLSGEATMLHLATVAIAKRPETWMSHFRGVDARRDQDLQELIEKIQNPTVRPLLMFALYQLRLGSKELWEAHLVARRISLEHPDFPFLFDSMLESERLSREAKELYEWVIDKGQSPVFHSEHDLDMFKPRGSLSQRPQATNAAIGELARRVELLDEDQLTPQEQMGRQFVLYQASIEPRSNLAKLVSIAETNPDLAVHALRLIERIHIIDESMILPYVKSQIARPDNTPPLDPEAKKILRQKFDAGEVTLWETEHRPAVVAAQVLHTIRSNRPQQRNQPLPTVERSYYDIAKRDYRWGLPQHVNESVVSMIRDHGGDPSLFPFVEAYYLEHGRGKKSVSGSPYVGAFEQIGDRRAIPYLREIFNSVENKSRAARAIGTLSLPKMVKIRRSENPFDDALRNASDDRKPESARNAAFKVLLSDPDTAFQRAMQVGTLNHFVNDSRTDWSENELDQVAFIARFGDVAARQLLKASEGGSLEKRYCIAELLRLVLPTSRQIIAADAKDDSIDPDRKLTALLALKLN